MDKIKVLETEVSFYTQEQEDYLCITDIARHKNAEGTDDLIRNWLRNRNTIEFLGIWEQLHNPGFKPVEFDGFRKLAGLNSFTLTPKQWIEKTRAVGELCRPLRGLDWVGMNRVPRPYWRGYIMSPAARACER